MRRFVICVRLEHGLLLRGDKMTNPQRSGSSTGSKMKQVFCPRDSTKDVVVRYQESMQRLVDAMHQVQKDVKTLKDSHLAESAYQHGANEGIQVTLRELHQLTTPASISLDLHQGFHELFEGQDVIIDKQVQLLQMLQKMRENQVCRQRSVGLIEGLFRVLDTWLMKGFVLAANRHCGM